MATRCCWTGLPAPAFRKSAIGAAPHRGCGASGRPRAYPSDAVARVVPEESPLHLVAVAVRVEDLLVVETGAGPQDGLAVQLQGAHPVLLLHATAQQLPAMADWHVGEPGVDGICVTAVPHIPGGELGIGGSGSGSLVDAPPSSFALSPSLSPTFLPPPSCLPGLLPGLLPPYLSFLSLPTSLSLSLSLFFPSFLSSFFTLPVFHAPFSPSLLPSSCSQGRGSGSLPGQYNGKSLVPG